MKISDKLIEYKNIILSILVNASTAMIKHQSKNLGRKGFLSLHLSKEVRATTQGNNLKSGTEGKSWKNTAY